MKIETHKILVKFRLGAVLFMVLLVAIPFSGASAQSIGISSPFGGRILTVLPNPPTLPTLPPTPNPCYSPSSYLLIIGPPSPGMYVLNSFIHVYNGTNPPMPGVWSLGLKVPGLVCPTIILIGVGNIP
jgi:hypothetical protein